MTWMEGAKNDMRKMGLRERAVALDRNKWWKRIFVDD